MHLPKITGDTWFNSPPLTPEDLKDKVVLVDFWTYSCVNCLRTLPYLQKWWEKYQPKLIIIGVHTPEFSFEKDPDNVRKALDDLRIEWPVVLDNNYDNWHAFTNHYWPAKYLSNQEGEIVYNHFGEGNYKETELQIQKLLKLVSLHQPMPQTEEESHQHGAVCFIPTPELYCGYKRGEIANFEGYQQDQAFTYQPPAMFPPDSIGLSGKFFSNIEYLESQESGSALLLNFRATEVNIVLNTPDRFAVVTIELNNAPLSHEISGTAVQQNGTVVIERPTLYNLIKSTNLVEGILKITAKQGNFQAFAFTFSGCS
jgi:thiol-disulfide isomerase/thioredoxin